MLTPTFDAFSNARQYNLPYELRLRSLTRHGEHDRARVIYRHAVDAFEITEDGMGQDGAKNEEMRRDLYKAYVSFEKKVRARVRRVRNSAWTLQCF